MIIDAHQHFWVRREPFDHSWQDAPQLAPLRRDFLPADLKPLIDKVGVDRTVFVQTQHKLAENDFVLDLAAKNSWIAGVDEIVVTSPNGAAELLTRATGSPRRVAAIGPGTAEALLKRKLGN